MIRLFLILTTLLMVRLADSQSLPEGFFLETVTDQIPYPVGMVHTGREVSYVWSQDGKLWEMTGHQISSGPVIDISDEVGFWSDHGMLGVALHPDFLNNGWIYLMYVVDRYHLYHGSDSQYDAGVDEYNQATIARITRYTIDLSNPGQVLPDSRKIIIGTGPVDGIPITTKSHGIGTLLFGRDTSLLFSVGDGSAPGKDFVGQQPFPDLAFDQQALDDGILREEENIGAYRSQFLNSYCGKILRVDPETGEGLPTNPFYSPERKDEPVSKVWALGFRNPFRMTLYPGSASEANGPGNLLVGDVGDWSWEEINIVDGPGLNFGWPVFQGQESYYLFRDKEVPNYDAPIGGGNCSQQYFYFKDLIVQATTSHSVRFAHPCDDRITVPESVPTFVHQRPVMSYANWISDTVSTFLPGFSEDGKAVVRGIHDPGTSLEYGDDFNGSSSIGGVFYTMDAYPDSMRNAYFHGDFHGWLRVLTFNQNREVRSIQNWADGIGGVVQMTENPYDQNVYIVTHDPHRIQKLSFEGNRKPVIICTPDTVFGAGPLTVRFDASESYDPEGGALNFVWELGDEILSTAPGFQYTFAGDQPQSHTIQLTVTDISGSSSHKDILISVNNTPPEVDIVTIQNSDKYSILHSTEWPLEAEISDKEHSAQELKYEWTVFLHHNTHFHQESQFTTPTARAYIEPLGCGIETYYYRIRLSVEDPLGLKTVREKYLYPNCDEVKTEFRIFPNPADRYLTLQAIGMDGGEVKVFLHDARGRLHFKAEKTLHEGGGVRLNLPNLPSGIYTLQVLGEHFRIRKKVSIAH